MAQDSKRARYLRRLKRQNTLLFRQTQHQQTQLQQLAQGLMKSQKDWNDLKATLEQAEQAEMQPTPAVTVTKVEDETESYGDYEAAFGDLRVNEQETL
jgi:phage shock protein A